MTARIFKPAKNAMQSGTAKTKEWQLDYEPEQPRSIEPLMGWTSSGDMKQQLTLRFADRNPHHASLWPIDDHILPTRKWTKSMVQVKKFRPFRVSGRGCAGRDGAVTLILG